MTWAAERMPGARHVSWLCLIGCAVLGCGRARSGPGSDAADNAGGTALTGGGSAGEGEPAEGGSANGGSGSSASAGTNVGGGEAGANSTLKGLPLPAHCQALRGEQTELLCALDFSCGAVADSITCYGAGSGPWQCTCQAPNADRTYLVQGAAGLNACAVAAGLCSDSRPAIDVEGCAPTREELGTVMQPGVAQYKTCALDLACQTPVPVDFAPGARAKLLGGATARCSEAYLDAPRSPEVRVNCDVTVGKEARSYAVVAKGGVAKSCRPVLESFLSSKEPVFTGSESCVREELDSGSSSFCGLTERCFESAPLSDGVSLVKDPSARGITCGLDSAGILGCVCSFGQVPLDSYGVNLNVFPFEVGPAQPPASCDLSRCSPEMKVEPTGPGECDEDEGVIDDVFDGCNGFFLCSQPVTFEGREMTRQSQMNARCARAADQSFYCGCSVGNETAIFHLGEAATNSEACAMARPGCFSRMTLPVGPALNSSVPPDPLP